MVTRRSAILAGAGIALASEKRLLAFASKDFWNTKEPSEWSDKEVTKLLTQSPWAKETSAEFGGGTPDGRSRSGSPGGVRSGGMGGGMGGMGGGMGGMGGGSNGPGGAMGGRVPTADGDMGGGGMTHVKVTVVWESAWPVRQARKKNAETDPPYYVVSMTGIPLSGGDSGRSSENTAEHIKETVKDHTTLQAKGRDPISPEKVEVGNVAGGNMAVFYFPKSPPLTIEDKEVTFSSKLGPMQIKVKFGLKEMEYKNQLSV